MEAIIELILEYRENREPTPLENETSKLNQAQHRQRTIGLHPFLCGFLCQDWVKLQHAYLTKSGSRRCANRWVAQLLEKLIKIIFDMWNHRNKVLHKKDNTITERQHNNLNETIQSIYSDLPNMRLFTATERHFFRHSTKQQVQHFNIHRKRQWIKRAQSIIGAFERKQNNTDTGNPLILMRAIGIQQHFRDQRPTQTIQRQPSTTIHSTETQRSTQITKTKTTTKTKTKTKQRQNQQKYTNICLSVKHGKNSATSKIRGKYIINYTAMQVREPARMSVQSVFRKFVSNTGAH